eukprot:CAMPEP_0194744806 /NCGR_PEP_ID=MMETSP0296-20130528/101070_1 /TAXON_ID=39354 /ORGANISM="Heterosigma akashiwo, Strain CCMP2393" /LENGTH=309 /DNA_ID=CAMNT_0039656989 /DNA_START=165 /DNA_END=1094 /DNA_ORIENTATION=-
MAGLTGGAGCFFYSMFHLLIFVWLVGLMPPDLEKFSVNVRLVLYLNLAHITLSSVCLSIVYGYVMNLAEALGAVSRSFSRNLTFLLFMVSSSLTCIGMRFKRYTPSMVAIVLVVALGEIGAHKVDRHAALQNMMSEGDGTFQNVSDRAMRAAVLTNSLKTYTEFMKKGVLLNVFLGFALAAVDFLDLLFPAASVAFMNCAVFTTTFIIQKKMVNFLHPRSPSYLHQQASTLYQRASVREPAILGSSTLAIVRAFCWRRAVNAGRQEAVAARVFPGVVSVCGDNVAEIKEVEKKEMEEMDSIMEVQASAH